MDDFLWMEWIGDKLEYLMIKKIPSLSSGIFFKKIFN
jgi:hypothetical protein